MVAVCFVLVLGSFSPCFSPLSLLTHSSSLSPSSPSSHPSPSADLYTTTQGRPALSHFVNKKSKMRVVDRSYFDLSLHSTFYKFTPSSVVRGKHLMDCNHLKLTTHSAKTPSYRRMTSVCVCVLQSVPAACSSTTKGPSLRKRLCRQKRRGYSRKATPTSTPAHTQLTLTETGPLGPS